MCKYPGSRALSVATENLAGKSSAQVCPAEKRVESLKRPFYSSKYLDDKKTRLFTISSSGETPRGGGSSSQEESAEMF